MKKKFKKVMDNFRAVLKRPEMGVLPGQMAFYFLMSLVPIVAMVAFIASKFAISLDLLSYIDGVLPATISSFIDSVLDSASSYNNLLLLLFLYVFLGSNGPKSVIVASNALYGIKQKGYFETKMKAMIMTIVMIILILFIIVIPVFGDLLIGLLIKNFSLFQSIEKYGGLYQVIKILTSFFIIYVNIKLLYTMAPNKNIKSRDTTVGAMFTTVSWILVTEIFSFYITNIAKYDLLYGNFANLLVILLWIYFLSYLFVIGIAINVNRYNENKEEIGSGEDETKIHKSFKENKKQTE